MYTKGEIIERMMKYVDECGADMQTRIRKSLQRIPAVELRKCCIHGRQKFQTRRGLRSLPVIKFTPFIALTLHPEYFDAETKTAIETPWNVSDVE
jgi:hypothetical protein